MSLKPATEHVPLAEIIPIKEVLADHKTVWVQRGNHFALTQVISISGLDYRGLEEKEVENLFRMRRESFGNISGLEVSIHCQRRRKAFKGEVEDHKHALVDKMVTRHNNRFSEVYSTEWFMVVTIPLDTIISGKLLLPSEDFLEETGRIEQRCKELSGRVQQICKMLEDYAPEVLTHDSDHSRLLEFWSYVINGGKEYIPSSQSTCLSHLLPVDHVSFPRGSKTVLYDADGDPLPVLKIYLIPGGIDQFTGTHKGVDHQFNSKPSLLKHAHFIIFQLLPECWQLFNIQCCIILLYDRLQGIFKVCRRVIICPSGHNSIAKNTINILITSMGCFMAVTFFNITNNR